MRYLICWLFGHKLTFLYPYHGKWAVGHCPRCGKTERF